MNAGENVKKLVPGQQVIDFFVVRRKELRFSREQKPYLLVELGHPSGRIQSTVWDQCEQLDASLSSGDVVKVMGTVVAYRDGKILQIEKIRKARPEEKKDPSSFIPEPKQPVESLLKRLDKLLATIENPFLKALLENIFSSDSERALWEKAPAGKLWHHNRSGGLLEHSLAVASICRVLCEAYSFLHRDLLLTGALLHDLGKIECYESDKGFIEYSNKGRLIGHVVLGSQKLQHRIAEIPDFPEELALQLQHLLLSHHGDPQKGAPIVPMSPEAIVLHFADEIDSQLDAYLRIAENEVDSESSWSRYVRLMDRFFYFPPHLKDAFEQSSE